MPQIRCGVSTGHQHSPTYGGNMKRSLSLGLILFVVNAFAGLGEDFRDLKNSGSNYEIVGTVCEEVTRLRFQEEFPAPKYGIVRGIEYGDGSRTIGELDVVVFDNSTHRVYQIAEIKCWKNNESAIQKAQSQIQRFNKTLQSGGAIKFKALYSKNQFRRENFLQNPKIVTIAPAGSKAAGFDRELEYSLKELMQLRDMMIKCQASGQCSSNK